MLLSLGLPQSSAPAAQCRRVAKKNQTLDVGPGSWTQSYCQRPLWPTFKSKPPQYDLPIAPPTTEICSWIIIKALAFESQLSSVLA